MCAIIVHCYRSRRYARSTLQNAKPKLTPDIASRFFLSRVAFSNADFGRIMAKVNPRGSSNSSSDFRRTFDFRTMQIFGFLSGDDWRINSMTRGKGPI